MKILITGSEGQVGWELCRQAHDQGFDIVETGVDDLDITDIDAVRGFQLAEMAQIVVNAAAYTAVDKAESEPDLARRVNAFGARNLAQVGREHNIPILHISTDYVFNGCTTRPWTDDADPDPLGVYGKTKLEGEKLVATTNPRHLILRTSWVFGIHGNNFVRTILRHAAVTKELNVVADQFGCPTYAGDISRTLLALADRYRRHHELPWGIYNYCGAGVITWYAFARKIIELGVSAGLVDKGVVVSPIPTAAYPTVAARPEYSALDCTHFERTFPEIGISGWEAGLREMIAKIAGKEDI